jgi:hypothetical protein
MSGNLDIRKKGAGPIYHPDTKDDRAGRVNSAEESRRPMRNQIPDRMSDEWTQDGKPEPEEVTTTKVEECG